MALQVVDGDYVMNARGGVETVSGRDELLQRIKYKLTARRGAFPLMPALGSRLWMLRSLKPSERRGAAEVFIREALENENEIRLENVVVTATDENIRVEISFAHSGGTIEMTLRV